MFAGLGSVGKKNKILVGFDLGDHCSQISIWRKDEPEPQTLSTVVGEEIYNFPTALCKRKEVNQWTYGREAIRLSSEENGLLVDDLVEKARSGEMVSVGEESFDPISLLALFMKRSLALIRAAAPDEKMEGMMITCHNLDHRMIEVLKQCVELMKLDREKVFFQSHVESFYFYTINQPKELWNRDVLVCELQEKAVRICRLECNRRTSPMVAYVEEEQAMIPRSIDVKEISTDPEERKRLDQWFRRLAEESCKNRIVGTAYILGPVYEPANFPESTGYLCRGRRVFQGDNLYSKGACYGVRERVDKDDQAPTCVFLGNDKLKSNIGMNVYDRGKEGYLSLLDAGINWFECYKECEFILEKGNSFSLLITPLTESSRKEVEIILTDMPERSSSFVCLKLVIFMQTENQVRLKVEDLGFGEITPASHKIWEEEFTI